MPGLFPAQSAPPAQKTLLQKVLPLIHVVAAWLLLAYFVFWKEPETFSERAYGVVGSENRWSRWAELSRRKPDETWGVQFVPFFWAFTTLTLVLHTWRIFQGLDPVRPPMILSLALQYMPPSLSSLILNIMKYLQIGNVFIDDVAALIFGMGVLIWLASLFTD
ncbi:hypothetical protein NM688_g4873 [Phlebia brevispora]|uniref:Uncharacterized protein n=1 Tax=Phlebia brevispora TaxID=194682 RepID=A0ACC1T1Z2_9APHY|nr:hypothetical protein NM688_g4873 [Phlebia brevispora]